MQKTLIELKAYAYDILAQIEYLQRELNKTNEEIAKEAEKEKQNNAKK
jgi:hypothetical protein